LCSAKEPSTANHDSFEKDRLEGWLPLMQLTAASTSDIPNYIS